MSNILVDGNEIRNCLLGQSESLVLNGNVTNFIVSNNIVHDNDNIGIDFIGFEGTGPTGSDQARNGVCTDNTVYNISSLTNPTYGGDRSADGIYVDGGLNIVIERNNVYNCDIGIELASEHLGKNTQDITVRNNFISGSYQANIMAGGYASNRGNSVNIVIVNNTTYQGAQGELALQFNCSNITIKNNIFYAKASQDYLQEWGGNNTGITVSNNLYFGQSTTSPGSWADARARYTNPRLNSPPGNLHLTSTSPAIDTGLSLGNDGSGNPLSGSLDIDKEARVANAAIEIGADEFATALPVELLNFIVTLDDKHCVSINWQTSSEYNSDYYEVQRSTNVRENDWQTIAHLPSAGFSTTLQSYTQDDCPLSGISYYRLKQVDVDGQFTFSTIRAVQIGGNELQILLTNEGVGIISPEATKATLSIYSELGQELVQKQIQLNANTYYPISIGLQNGVYLFYVATLENSVWKKVPVRQ